VGMDHLLSKEKRGRKCSV